MNTESLACGRKRTSKRVAQNLIEKQTQEDEKQREKESLRNKEEARKKKQLPPKKVKKEKVVRMGSEQAMKRGPEEEKMDIPDDYL